MSMILLDRYEKVDDAIIQFQSEHPHIKHWKKIDAYPIEINEKEGSIWLRLLGVDKSGGDIEAQFDLKDFQGAKIITRDNPGHSHIVLLITEDVEPEVIMEPFIINHVFNKEELDLIKKEADEMWSFFKPRPLAD